MLLSLRQFLRNWQLLCPPTVDCFWPTPSVFRLHLTSPLQAVCAGVGWAVAELEECRHTMRAQDSPGRPAQSLGFVVCLEGVTLFA